MAFLKADCAVTLSGECEMNVYSPCPSDSSPADTITSLADANCGHGNKPSIAKPLWIGKVQILRIYGRMV